MISLKQNEIIVFSGDSITDGGRSRNMDLNHNLGHGYQYILAARMCMENMEKRPRFINKGYSGAGISVIYNSWYKDVIAYHPSLISILIGINDIFRGDEKTAELIAKRYEKTYEMLLRDTRELLPDTRLVLCEPFFIPARKSKEFVKYSPNVACEDAFFITDIHTKEELDYITGEIVMLQQAVRRLAEKYDCIFVPLQEEFEKALKNMETEYLLWDGVHPTVAGHGILAEKWYKCVESSVINQEKGKE